MPLVSRVATAHTIAAFRAAAGQRYREGRELATSGRRLASIYLWGYAAEMLLKAAYFRLHGWSPIQPITLADLQSAKLHALTVHGLAWPGNLHHLRRWTDLLIEERRLLGVPFPGVFARSLQAKVKSLYLNWREHLRYYPNRPYRGEVFRCHEAVSWLLGEFRHL